MADLIDRQAAIDALAEHEKSNGHNYTLFVDIVSECAEIIRDLPSVQPEQEDYTEMKREFIRMAEYIDVLLKVSDEQKETLIGFISRLAEFMPWTERD